MVPNCLPKPLKKPKPVLNRERDELQACTAQARDLRPLQNRLGKLQTFLIPYLRTPAEAFWNPSKALEIYLKETQKMLNKTFDCCGSSPNLCTILTELQRNNTPKTPPPEESIHIHVYMYIYIHTYMCIQIGICVYIQHVYRMHVRTYVRMYVCLCICTCI